MDPKKYEAKKIKVDGACGITITTSHIDPGYDLRHTENVDATGTGHILLFKLAPLKPGLPRFSGRWDDAAQSVDVDLDGPRHQRLAFKWGVAGYSGHHTTRPGPVPKYVVDIIIPGSHVFQGEITLGTNIGVKINSDALQMEAGVLKALGEVKLGFMQRVIRCLGGLWHKSP